MDASQRYEIVLIYADKIFENPVESIKAFLPEEVKTALDRIEELKTQGLYLVGYIRYDLSKVDKGMPLVYFDAFRDCTTFEASTSAEFPIGTIVRPQITKEQYIKNVTFIKDQIRNGVTYEVNYTYPSQLQTNACDFELYQALLKNQTTPYNAFLQNKYETILSFSPELFFTLDGRKIKTKPMKGTIKRGATAEEDSALKNFLQNDEKNRSENIMIVDLLRNDLGRISKTGSVRVDRLFEVEQHKTLFQMTSEISAELDESAKLYDIIQAIYPCGSITGAPKKSTMKIIAEVEPYSRGVYCGAIGYIHKDHMEFSVPIRILQKTARETDFTYFAGSAIVWDSSAEDEWQETLTKTKFLEVDNNGKSFSLIETGITDSEMHLERLKKSASALGFKWNAELENFKFDPSIVNRIELFKNGHFEITTRPIPAPAQNPKVKIVHRVNSQNPFLYHKTSIRFAHPVGVFDELCINEKGEITEGTFTSIAVLQKGILYTPPLKCGLLNGVTRRKFLENGKMQEKVLYPSDLEHAEKIYCFNSVRGLVEVELC